MCHQREVCHLNWPGGKKKKLYMEYFTIRHYAYSYKIDFNMWKLELIMENKFCLPKCHSSQLTIKIISITPLQSASQSHKSSIMTTLKILARKWI